MKRKNLAFRKLYFAYRSLSYNPENDLLYLEESAMPYINDLLESVASNGYLEDFEYYKGRYNSDHDIRQSFSYWQRKERDKRMGSQI